MPVKVRDNEDGFTMIMTVIGVSLVALLVAVAAVAVNGDAHLTSRDLARKQAYEAAKAGIDEYAYHLHENSGYWSECTAAGGTEPNALNQPGETANRRTVPGEPNASYAIELIPATGHGDCDGATLATATASMIETQEAMKGTFRIRSNGYSGDAHVAITATFKPASFLDYVYFTQLETSDPVTYGVETLIDGAERQCTKTIRDERYASPMTNEEGKTLNTKGGIYEGKRGESAKYCDTISFVHGDYIKGPMHTNDAFVICEDPTLGRDSADPVEVSSPEPGWYSTKDPSLHNGSSCTGNPDFQGTFRTKSPVLVPPETNTELETIAEPAYTFEGETSICLEGASMTVASGHSCSGGVTKPLPANGVVYVRSISCTGNFYSPFDLAYPETVSQCGNVNVKGTYSEPLTIAAANDVLIVGNLEKTDEEGMLGLIANNFIRVYHPVTLAHPSNWVSGHWENGTWVEGHWVEDTSTWECTGNATGVLDNLQIEAAILAINHSFIVDNYDCGSALGTLNVKGAIAQNFRGAVGTGGGSYWSTGYLKNYEYDERFKTTEPPSFIQPIKSDWVIGRETTE